jgi:hypothetical protein
MDNYIRTYVRRLKDADAPPTRYKPSPADTFINISLVCADPVKNGRCLRDFYEAGLKHLKDN